MSFAGAMVINSTTTSFNINSINGIIVFNSTLALSNGALNVSAAGSYTFNGLVTQTGPSTSTISNTISPAVFNFNAGYNLNSGGSTATFVTTGGPTINFGGNFTNATGAVVLDPISTSVFTVNSTITPTAAITFGNFQISSGITTTLAGNISVTGNWLNNGTLTTGTNGVTFNGTTAQTITNTTGETFYNLTSNTSGSGLIILASTTNVTVTNALTMTSGNFNLNGSTLQLGNAAASTLNRTSGIMYGGYFKRYWPVGAITTANYGLFPVGSSTQYRPITIASTGSNPTGAGYITASHIDATNVINGSITENGAAVTDRTGMTSTLTNSSGTNVIGGSYVLDVAFTALPATGVLSQMQLVSITNNAITGTIVNPSTGSVSSPVGHRGAAGGYILLADMIKTWALGTTNLATTPLRRYLYSRKAAGNWTDNTAGTGSWSLTGGGAGAACGCAPVSSDYVVISAGQTITVNAASSADYVDILSGAILTGGSGLTVGIRMTTAGSGGFTPTAAWTVSGDLTMAGTGASTVAALLTVSGKLTIGSGTSLTLTPAGGGATYLTVAGDFQVDGTLDVGVNNSSLTGVNKIISGTNGTILGTGLSYINMSQNKTIAAGTILTIAPIALITGLHVVTNYGTINAANVSGFTGPGDNWINASNSTLNITGALFTVAGTLTATAGGNVVNYNGSGAQTVYSTTYDILMCSNAGTKTAAGSFVVNGNVTIQNAAIFDETSNIVSGGGGLTMTGTSSLLLSRSSAGTYPELSGSYSLTGGTVDITNTQPTTVFGATYYNLILRGTKAVDMSFVSTVVNDLTYLKTSFSLTLGIDLTVGGLTTVGGAGTFDMNGVNLNTGSFLISAGTFRNLGAAASLTITTGDFTNNGGTFNPANITTVFTGTGAQNITGSATTTPFLNLTINNSSFASVTMVIDATVTSNFTMTSTSGIFNTALKSLSGAGGFTAMGGDFQVGGISAARYPELTGTYSITGGTVTFNGVGAQVVRSATVSIPVTVSSYNNIVFGGVSGSGSKTLEGNIIVAGNLTISGTTTVLNTNTKNITLAGNWACTSTAGDPLLESTGTVTFNGASSQTVSTTSALGATFNNLTENNATSTNVLTVNSVSGVTVNGVLTLTSGQINTTATQILTLGTAATVVAPVMGTNTSFVNGPMVKNTNTTAAFTFPVGKSGVHHDLIITPASTTATVWNCEYFIAVPISQGALGAGVNHISDAEYWNLTRGSGGGASAIVSLAWDINSIVTLTSTLMVTHFDGTNWVSDCACTNSGTPTAGPGTAASLSLGNSVFGTTGASTLFTLGSANNVDNDLGNTRYSVANGVWNATTSWASRTGGPAGASVPVTGKRVVIEGGFTITVDGARTCSKLTIGSVGAGTLDFGASTNSIAAASDLIINANGSIISTNAAAKISTTGNMIINANVSSALLSLERLTTAAQTISGTGTVNTLTISATTTNMGDLTVTNDIAGTSTLTNGATGILRFYGSIFPSISAINCSTVGNTMEFKNSVVNYNFTAVLQTWHHLILNGTGTMVNSSALTTTVNGNFTISAGTTFDQSFRDKNFIVNGHWTNSGTFFPSTLAGVSISLGGTTQQNVNSGGSSFYNLILNNTAAAGVVLTSDMNIASSGQLTLNSKYLTLGNYNLTLLATATNSTNNIAGSPSSTHFIVTNGTGLMRIEKLMASRTFPVGTSTSASDYTPLTLSNTGTADRFDVKVCNNIYRDGTCAGASQFTTNVVNKTWTLNELVSGGSVATLTLQWNAANEATGFVRNACNLAHYTGGFWVPRTSASTSAGIGPFTQVASGISTFSPQGVESNGILPIELLSFDATRVAKNVELNWTTGSETNNDFFTVEKTTNGILFEEVGKVKGAGNSSNTLRYALVDVHPVDGVNYYRLKQTDYNGKFEYSKLVSIDFKNIKNFVFNIYPNPSDGEEIYISSDNVNDEKEILVVLYNAFGEIVYSKVILTENGTFISAIDPSKKLSSGVYLVVGSSNNDIFKQKLVIRE